jgi:ubiquinone/menaquinone biosynthesis C-methylase UbiE
MKKEKAPATSGITIRWPRLYDLLLTVMTLGREKHFRKTILDLAGVKEGEAVLDIGSGTGTLAIVTKSRVGDKGSVCGIDAAPEMVERARQKAEGAGLDIEFQLAVAERLPFPDRRFDVVINTFVLHHLPMDIRGTALAEMRRVLKPSGRMLAADFDLGASLPLIEGAGFRVIESGRTMFKILSYVLTKPEV